MTKLQRVLMVVGIASIFVSLLAVLTSLFTIATAGMFAAVEYGDILSPEDQAEFQVTVTSNDPDLDIAEIISIAMRASMYSAFVGFSLLVCGIYAVFCARRNGRLLRLSRLATVSSAITVAGILWIPWRYLSPSLFVPMGVSLGLQLGVQYLSRELRKQATGEAAAELAYEESRKHMTREERLADDTRLGFLRVIQVFYLFNMLIMITGLIFAHRNSITYDFTELFDWANLVFVSINFYLIHRRLEITRKWVIVFSVVKIALNTIHILVLSGIHPSTIGTVVLMSLWDVIVLLYFIFSKRVRLIMTKELSLDVQEGDELVLDRRSLVFWRNIALYYCIFSTLGHWMEAAFCQLVAMGLFKGDIDFNNTMLFRDWLYPFPMHGFAVVLIALILWPFKEWLRKRFNEIVTLAISFFVNMAFCTGIEFGGGMMFNRNLQLWDYRDIPFNFMGQICLQNAVGFGFAATLIVYLVYPNLERFVAKVPKDVMSTLSVGIFTFYAILTALYLVDFSPEAAEANAKMISTVGPLVIRPGGTRLLVSLL